jgi:hypothetical protein
VFFEKLVEPKVCAGVVEMPVRRGVILRNVFDAPERLRRESLGRMFRVDTGFQSRVALPVNPPELVVEDAGTEKKCTNCYQNSYQMAIKSVRLSQPVSQ